MSEGTGNSARAASSSVTWVTAFALGVAFAALSLAALSWLLMSPARRALPGSARDIREFTEVEEGFLPQDFSYLLKARMPADELPAYAERLGLTPFVAGQTPTTGTLWRGGSDEPWWDPPSGLVPAYGWCNSGAWTVVLYANGFVYVSAGCI